MLCDELAAKDEDLKQIISQYGYPPLWSRKPSFTTLIHFILEQQVSLASAKAALLKLEAYTGNITPKKILHLTDEELKSCYFSRQKTVYARGLANAVLNKEISIENLVNEPDDEVRIQLIKLKGIGEWTADVFLMMSLHRLDCFPIKDVALVSSIKQVKNLAPQISNNEILLVANQWQPYRTIAAYLLWYSYLERKKLPAKGDTK